MAFPKKSWRVRGKEKAVESEAPLQKFTDDYLEWQHIRSIRVPDKVFNYINAPFARVEEWFKIWFNSQFAGMPDNTVLIDIGGGYLLGLPIELKSRTGKLHGRQKSAARVESWRVCKSPEAVEREIKEALRIADVVKEAIDKMA